MEETKNTKTQEAKVEFNLEEEVKKSKVIKSYKGLANFTVEPGKFKSYQLKCATKIDGKNHTRLERLSENRNQFLIKYLVENNKASYDAEFQVRQNNETERLFYCWVITFTDSYKYPMLVGKDERNYLESFVLPKEYIEKKDK